MSNSYDQVATVTIDIATTVVDSSSFDGMLIVGPLPKVTPETAPAECGKYESLEEVTNAGWVASGDDADPVGIAARIAFSQDPEPTQLYIAPIQTDESGTAEYITDTVERALATNEWYVVCPVGVEDEDIIALAEYIENSEKFMTYPEKGFFSEDEDDDDAPLVDEEYDRTAAVFIKESATQEEEDIPEENYYAHIAFTVAWLANEAGSETSAFKRVYEIEPANLTPDQQKSLKENSVNYITTIGSKVVTMVGRVLSGEWCDIIRFRDWIKNEMQSAVAETFFAVPKVPFTDKGISLIENAIESTLQRGQAVGGIAETEYSDDGSEIPGYKISVPLASSLTDKQKASRDLSGFKFTAKLTGAIHYVEIRGSLAYSL